MPELDLNYDPPWMRKGGAPDMGQPMSLAEAFQLKQRQQQIDSEKALLPLKIQEAQQQIANAALDHTIKQEHADMLLKTKDADQSAWADLAKITDPSDPAQQAEWFKGRALKPWMSQEVSQFAQATFKNADLNSKTVQQLQNKLDLETLKTPKEPTAVDVVNKADSFDQQADAYESTGDTFNADRLRKNATLLRGTLKTPGSADTAGVKNAKERLSAFKSALSASGGAPLSPAEEAVKYQQFVDEQTALPNEETRTELGPGGTVQSITTRRGFGKTGPTVAAESKVQTDLMKFRGSLQLLENMTSQIRPQDVGLAGKIGELQNKILGQFDAGGDFAVSGNRSQAEGAVTGFIQSQLLRGRITEHDKQRLLQAFVDPQAKAQSYGQIMAAAGEMKKLLKMEAITTAQGNVPLQPWMFIGLEWPKDYKNLIKTGTLTEQEALAQYKNANFPQ